MDKNKMIQDFLHLFDTTSLRNSLHLLLRIQVGNYKNLGESIERLEQYVGTKNGQSILFDEIKIKLTSFSEVYGREFPLRELYKLSRIALPKVA